MKPLIAVSGRNGQLGWELQRLSTSHPEYDFIFCDRDSLDITNEDQVTRFFGEHQPAVFINCAAYTAVDKAETEQVAAYKVNTEAVSLLARLCRQYESLFISFSTDYVFNGQGKTPYKETDATDPVNYYGYTKEMGERLALANCDKTIVIRTSWVYSAHGHNFVKTMLRLMRERETISVVNDQLGTPTYAADLARVVMQIVGSAQHHSGIYHFSNGGVTTWFEFANEIRRLAELDCVVQPIPTSAFPTPAKRPAYSVLAKDRIQQDFDVHLEDWQESLHRYMQHINEKSGS